MKFTEVAAAVIERPDGSFLLGQRAPGTFYAGYWEFPGGKLEAGETAVQALVRELHEELGIEVLRADPWLRREHQYEHAHVSLNFFRVREWRGELQHHVHSALSWQTPEALKVSPMLPANAAVLAALALPDFYAITQAGTLGVDKQLRALQHALEAGLKLVQIREPQLESAHCEAFARQAVSLCHRYGARVLINGDAELARASGADGLHLRSAQLLACIRRPEFELVGASCHDARELAQAAALGCDFAVLGSVNATSSHPGVAGIGWAGFADRIAVSPLPTFAIGGLDAADRDSARRAGAHGVAAIRAAWK